MLLFKEIGNNNKQMKKFAMNKKKVEENLPWTNGVVVAGKKMKWEWDEGVEGERGKLQCENEKGVGESEWKSVMKFRIYIRL